MNNIINFIPQAKVNPSFRLSAEWKDDMWHIRVEDFHNKSMPIDQMYREIAEALAPVATGLVKTAEEMEPTKRGMMVANILMYRDGTITLHSQPLNTQRRKTWFLNALERVREHAIPKKRTRKT